MVNADPQVIDVDAIMARIRERVRARRKQQRGGGATGLREQTFSIALKHAQLSLARQCGLQQTLARPAARLFLRVARLISQDARGLK